MNAGSILRVDLTNKNINMEPTEKYSERWLGGRAVNTWILLNELDPKTGWNDPENLLIFGTGALVGTLAPGACRTSVETKNALTGGIGSANFGGFFGAELKFAGFDHLVIKGRCDRPVYLWIDDGAAEIRDAGRFWGKDTWETERLLREELGDERIRVASVGPAGENLVRSACIIADRSNAAGGCGCGAVMGSKNLKAIAVRGSLGVFVNNPVAFMSAVDEEMKKIERWPLINGIREKGYYGALGGRADSPTWDHGYRPVRNGQDDYWDKEKVAKISEQEFRKYRKGTKACFGCPVSCRPWILIKNAVNRIEGEGWWNNSANSYCTKTDNTDLAAAIQAHFLANKLGLDGDNAAQAISWAFECYEKGIITSKDTDGLELTWGNHRAMIEMLKKTAFREGLGDLLAEGAMNAARKIGKGSQNFVVHVKGQDSLDGVRINKGWGFGVVLSPVGGRHLRGSLSGFWERPGVPVNSYDRVPEELFYHQKKKAVQDMLGLCSYIYGQTLEDWVFLLNGATGRNLSEEELLYKGLQAQNLEKAFNTIHAGFTRKDDYPCRRYFYEPVKSGPFKGERIDREKWEAMLDRFYQLNGWDIKTGLQTREGLIELGLADVASLIREQRSTYLL